LAVARDCRHCGSSALVKPEDPYHVFFECTAGNLATLRVALLAAVKEIWLKLLTNIDYCLQKAYPEARLITEELATTAAARALILLIDPTDLTNDLLFISYRLLWTLQWSSLNVPASATLATSLGKVFDLVFLRRSVLRTLANQWTDWSVKWTSTFGAEWRRLCLGAEAEAVLAAAPVPPVVVDAPRPVAS
jgi:hypothetical protein